MTQDLFLVVGGELVDLESLVFRDVSKLDVVGVFEGAEQAVSVWRGKAQATVDNALMRYIVLPLAPAVEAHGIKFGSPSTWPVASGEIPH
jgi:hypothetical protein